VRKTSCEGTARKSRFTVMSCLSWHTQTNRISVKRLKKSVRFRRRRLMWRVSAIGHFRRMTPRLPVNCSTCAIRKVLMSNSKVIGWPLRIVRPILQP
jgi:hypothetical protein